MDEKGLVKCLRDAIAAKYGPEYAYPVIILPPQAEWYYFGKPGKIPQPIRNKEFFD